MSFLGNGLTAILGEMDAAISGHERGTPEFNALYRQALANYRSEMRFTDAMQQQAMAQAIEQRRLLVNVHPPRFPAEWQLQNVNTGFCDAPWEAPIIVAPLPTGIIEAAPPKPPTVEEQLAAENARYERWIREMDGSTYEEFCGLSN